MMSNKTYIHYPADRLIKGKLWPHKIEVPEYIEYYAEGLIGHNFQGFRKVVYEKHEKVFWLALVNSIPFAEEFIEQIDKQIWYNEAFNEKMDFLSFEYWHPDPKKIYEIEGIETKVKTDCSSKSCIGECTECQFLQKVAIIKQAKEYPQESQDEILSSFFKKMVELHNDLNKIEKLKSEFHIQRK